MGGGREAKKSTKPFAIFSVCLEILLLRAFSANEGSMRRSKSGFFTTNYFSQNQNSAAGVFLKRLKKTQE
jgi:hypothetical protein